MSIKVRSGCSWVEVGGDGGGGTNANLPPYYALAYIMRTS
jgi:hypothetical protein